MCVQFQASCSVWMQSEKEGKEIHGPRSALAKAKMRLQQNQVGQRLSVFIQIPLFVFSLSLTNNFRWVSIHWHTHSTWQGQLSYINSYWAVIWMIWTFNLYFVRLNVRNQSFFFVTDSHPFLAFSIHILPSLSSLSTALGSLWPFCLLSSCSLSLSLSYFLFCFVYILLSVSGYLSTQWRREISRL